MKQLLLFFTFCSVLLAQNPGDSVFAGVKVHTIMLQFNQPNYWDSLTYYYSLGTEQYLLCSATVNGRVMDSIGVRLKGNASFAHPNNKKPMKIDFSEFNSGGRWDGLKSVHLNNCWNDPTLMREKLHLDFCRNAGIPAPRGNFAEVYINGSYWGLYSLEESVDKRFLGNHYPSTSGNLYKAVDAVGGSTNFVSDFLWYGSDTAQYQQRYELKTDEPVNAWNDLIRVIDTLNNGINGAATFPAMVDLRSVLRAYAADNMLGNLDSYIGSGRNFYFYNLTGGISFTWIVWDAGLSFGAFPGGPSSIETMSLVYTSTPASRPLANFIFTNSLLKNQFYSEVCRLNNRFFNLSDWNNNIDSIAAIIRPYVYADNKKMFSNTQFETNVSSDITPTGGRRIPGLKSFVQARKHSIQSQLSSAGVICNSSVAAGSININEFMAGNDTIPDPVGEFEDWIELYNSTADTIQLEGCYLSDNRISLTKWQFPAGIKISPFGYLIVWADEDTGQAGVHAGFKLSISGEQIILTNSDLTVLDSLSFGAQTTNISFARKPDGVGPFLFSAPTPGGSNGTTKIVDHAIPTEFALEQNYPNPFNPTTNILFALPEAGLAQMNIYSVLGESVFTRSFGVLKAGKHRFVWDGTTANGAKVPAGIYFYCLEYGTNMLIRKMILVK